MAVPTTVQDVNCLFKVNSPFIKHSPNSQSLPTYTRGQSILSYVSQLKEDIIYTPPLVGTTRMRVSTVLAVKMYAPNITVEIGELLPEMVNLIRVTTNREVLEAYIHLSHEYILIDTSNLYPFRAQVSSANDQFFFKGQETTFLELSKRYAILPSYFGEVPYNRIVESRKQTIRHIHNTIKYIMQFEEEA